MAHCPLRAPAKIQLAVDAAAHVRKTEQPIVLEQFLAKIEIELIERALKRARGNKTKAARKVMETALGVDPNAWLPSLATQRFRSSAPEAALASAPVSSGALRSWVMTAAAPKAPPCKSWALARAAPRSCSHKWAISANPANSIEPHRV